MCTHGDTVLVRVPVQASMSHTERDRWADKPVDRCLADAVRALNDIGAYTSGCCCGHSKGTGSILLHDGTEIILPTEREG